MTTPIRRWGLPIPVLALILSGCAGESPLATGGAPVTSASTQQQGGGGSAPTATEVPSTTLGPSTPPVATTEAATTIAAAATGTRQAPLAAGTPVTIGNWEVTVLTSARDATQAVLDENPFNEPPDVGDIYTTVRVAATYLGEGSASPSLGLTFGAVGASSVGYGFEDDCGVAPDGFPGLREVFPGGTVAGNLCWGVTEADLDGLVLYAEAAFILDDDRFFLEIPPEGVTHPMPPSGGLVPDGGPEGSRGNPIRPGDSVRVGDWEITVTGSTPDGAADVLAENPHNDPPAEGRSFFMVEVRATNRGMTSEPPFAALSFTAVGPSAVAYGFEDDCGVIPNAFPVLEEVFAGGTVSGNLCWSVTDDDAGALVLIGDPAISIEDERVFLGIP